MFAPALRAVISTACTHPFVNLRQLKFPQPADLVRGESFALAPTVNGILYNTQMPSDNNGCYPGLDTHISHVQDISKSF